ncbi:MAG: serpin family protein [Chthoniobacterales bacterium]
MPSLRSKISAGVVVLGFVRAVASADPAAQATNELGIDLYRQFASGSGNVCLSPYSITCALAMTLSGADGETRAEMSRVMHVTGDVDSSFGALQQALAKSADETKNIAAQAKSRGGPKEPIIFSVADRLFPQSGYKLRDEFVRRVQEHYGAAPEPLDFAKNGAGATKRINDWVAEQTHDRIRDLIPSPLDAASRLVLANALYFKAAWSKEFTPEATTPEPFHVNGSEPVDVPTMLATRDFRYAKTNDYTAVGLPYIGGEFQLLILLPREVNGLTELEKKLNADVFAVKLENAELDLHMPKFTFSPETMPLAQKLQALGMHSAFDQPPGSANFDRMAPRSPNDYLFISEVFHKTFIAVDEKGTEAAAATAVAMMAGSAVIEKPEPIEVKIDHPFIFAIQHVPSGACLFLGRVTDPR